MIDIFEYAERHNEDYYDKETDSLYHVKEYNRKRKFGLPVHGIRISTVMGTKHIWKN